MMLCVRKYEVTMNKLQQLFNAALFSLLKPKAPQKFRTPGHWKRIGVGRFKVMHYGHTGKYLPHQGKQECARRLRKTSAAYKTSGSVATA